MAITYHAGRRIQGLSDTTLGDSGWVTSDSTYINVNTTTEKIDWDLKNDNTDDHITYNLGTALSDTLWVFRCTFRFSTASGTAQFFAGMSSTGGAQNTTQDFIGTCILTGDNQFRSVDSDGATIPVSGDNLASYSWASNTDYFLEIKRTSATAYSCTVRTGSHAGSTVATASGTCTSTTVGLQYILFANRVDSNGGSPDLTIDDILIDDGTSTYSSADYEFDFGVQANKPTNVQVGSRFEETDTRKMYHYNQPAFDLSKLLGYYKFEEVSGNFANEDLGDTDWADLTAGTGSNAPNYRQTGKLVGGYCIDTNGNRNAYNISPSFDWSNNDWSVSAWVQMDSGVSNSYRGFFSTRQSGGAWLTLGTNNNGKIACEQNGGAYDLTDSSVTASGSGWNHVVFTYDATANESNFYVNNVLVDTFTQTSIGTSSQYVSCIWYVGQSNASWIGEIDELSIWHEVLTASKVSRIWNGGTGIVLEDATSATTWDEEGT